MVLQQFYEQKKAKIDSIVNQNRPERDRIKIGLYNDQVFSGADEERNNPIIMFKYKDIIWNTSSEKEYKADVDFCIYIVMQGKFSDDYIESFEVARQIDQAILLHPTQEDIRNNNNDIQNGVTDIELITNAAFKIREGQYTVEEDHWDKNNFYIWEISYKTTLIEKTYKKRYTMISNQFFNESDIDGGIAEEELRTNLRKLGYDLDDYHQVQYNGKDLLVYKNIDEQLSINDLNEIALNTQ